MVFLWMLILEPWCLCNDGHWRVHHYSTQLAGFKGVAEQGLAGEHQPVNDQNNDLTLVGEVNR